jgi:hypothetical protein
LKIDPCGKDFNYSCAWLKGRPGVDGSAFLFTGGCPNLLEIEIFMSCYKMAYEAQITSRDNPLAVQGGLLPAKKSLQPDFSQDCGSGISSIVWQAGKVGND